MGRRRVPLVRREARGRKDEAGMSAQEIGEKLVAFCRKGQNMESVETLYADDVVSVEAMDPPGGERTTKGKEAVKGKNTWWMENHEVHEASVDGPFPHGDDRFAVVFRYDVTFKPEKKRMKMEEVGVFTVKEGKVAKEEFFYGM